MGSLKKGGWLDLLGLLVCGLFLRMGFVSCFQAAYFQAAECD